MNNEQDQQKNQKALQNIKLKVLVTMHEVLQASQIGINTYKLLVAIETLQILYYLIHPFYTFMYTNGVFKGMRLAIQYLQIFQILVDSSSSSINTIFNIMSFIISFIVFFSLAICVFSVKGRCLNETSVTKSAIKVLAIFSVLINTVLTIPLYTSFENVIFCNKNSPLNNGIDCYKGSNIINMLVAIIGIILLTTFSIIINQIMIEINPNSTISFAGEIQKINGIKLVLKILLPFIFVVDYKATTGIGVAILLFLVCGGLVLIRYYSNPMINKSVFFFQVNCEILLFSFSFGTFVNAVIDNSQIDEMTFLYVISLVPFLSCSFNYYYNRKIKNLISFPFREISDISKIEQQFLIILDLIQNYDQLDSKLVLNGYFKNYQQQSIEEEEDNIIQQILQFPNDQKSEDLIHLFYNYFKVTIQKSINKNQIVPQLNLLNAFILNEKLDNQTKALHQLMIAEYSKPSIQQQFTIIRQRKLIEDQFQRLNNDEKKNTTTGNLDIESIVKFYNLFNEFQNYTEKCVNYHYQFWKELMESNPNLEYLQVIGNQITQLIGSIENQYNQLYKINKTSIHIQEMYSGFLRDVVHDENESRKVAEKLKQLLIDTTVRQSSGKMKKLQDENDLGMIRILCNDNDIGIIANCNKVIQNIFGYSQQTLIGTNINILQPLVYKEVHQDLLKGFVEIQSYKILNNKRVIFPKNIRGYIQKVELIVKMFPNLDEGLQLVGFFRNMNDDNPDIDESTIHYVMYNLNNGQIFGLSENMYTSFGVKSALAYGNSKSRVEFSIENVIPDFVDRNKIEESKTQNGLICQIDSSNIKQNFQYQFIVDHDDSDPENQVDYRNPEMYENDQLQIEVNEQEKESMKSMNTQNNPKYRKSRILANFIEEQFIGEHHIILMKFTELINEDEEDEQANKSTDSIVQQNFKSQKMVQSEYVHSGQQKKFEDEEQHEDQDKENVSMNSVSDENRILKDVKTLIKEQNEPKNIKILQRLIFLLLIVLVVLISVCWNEKIQQLEQIKEGIEGIDYIFERRRILAEINYQIRWKYFITKNIWVPQTVTDTSFQDYQYEDTTKALKKLNDDISQQVNLLVTTQNNCIQKQIKLQTIGGRTNQSKFGVDVLLENGVINKGVLLDLNDAIQIYSQQSNFISDKTLNLTENKGSQQTALFYIVRNGLTQIMYKVEEASDYYISFYKNLRDKYETSIIVINILQAVFLVVNICILIPFVFKVQQTNNKVLSYFGLIPISDIKELQQQCEDFSMNFLQDGVNESKKDVVHSVGHDKDKDDSYMEVDKDNDEMTNKKSEGDRKDKEKTEKQSKSEFMSDNKLEEQNMRANKLMNYASNKRFETIIKFFIIGLVYAGYIIANSQLYSQNVKNISNYFDQMQQLKLRPILFQNTANMVLEYLAQDPLYNITDPFNQVEIFRKRLLQNIKQIQNNIRDIEYTSEFNQFLDLARQLESEKVCKPYYGPLKKSEQFIKYCGLTADRVLDKGIESSIMKFGEDCLNACNQFKSNSKTSADQINYINGLQSQLFYVPNIRNLYRYVLPVITEMSKIFSTNFKSYLGLIKGEDTIVFSIGIAGLAIFFLFIWLPFLKKLSKKIWSTKGMLNIIPLEIITRNEQLLQAFISGELKQAVQ